MKKLLFAVTESRSANGICTKAVMKECVRLGYRVHCITNGELGEAAEYCSDGICYHTVKARLVYRLFALRDGCKKQSVKYRTISALAKTINKLKLLISVPLWPLISPTYANRIYKKALSLHKEIQFDAIIPIYTQIDTLIAAKRLKNKYSDIQYIPYFLDSFSGGYGPRCFSKEWTVKRGLKWERKLLPSADKIVMMRSAMPHYEKYCVNDSYYDKIVFLDLPLFVPNALSGDEGGEGKNKETVQLLYVGSIPAHVRDPRYFLTMFTEMKDKALRLKIIGTSTCMQVLEQFAQKDERISLAGQVSHEEAIKAIEEADVLVNLGNNNVQMTPSKIFEYMSQGKPIISTAPIKDEPSLKYLEKYPLKFIVYQDMEISENAQKTAEFIKSNYLKRAQSGELSRIFEYNTPTAFVSKVLMEEQR